MDLKTNAIYIQQPRRKAIVAIPINKAETIANIDKNYPGLWSSTVPTRNIPDLAVINNKGNTEISFLETTHIFIRTRMNINDINKKFGNKFIFIGQNNSKYHVVDSSFWEHFWAEYVAFKGVKEVSFNQMSLTDSLGNTLAGSKIGDAHRLTLTKKTNKVDQKLYDVLKMLALMRDGFDGWTDADYKTVGFKYKEFNKKSYNDYNKKDKAAKKNRSKS